MERSEIATLLLLTCAATMSAVSVTSISLVSAESDMRLFLVLPRSVAANIGFFLPPYGLVPLRMQFRNDRSVDSTLSARSAHCNRVAKLAVVAAIIGGPPSAFGKARAFIKMNRVIVGAHFKEIVFHALSGGPGAPVVDQCSPDPAAAKLRVDREQQ